jgi:hypothetical protein
MFHIHNTILLLFLKFLMFFVLERFIGLVLTFVAAYFFTYLHVFKQAVWTIMYMELIKEKELDKIG